MAALRNIARKCCQNFGLISSPRLPRGLCRYLNDGPTPIHKILNGSRIDSEVKFSGWVKSIRKQKSNTFLNISDGSLDRIQVVIPSVLCVQECRFNSAVEITGRLVKSPKENQPLEIHCNKLSVLGDMDLENFPFAPKKSYPPDYIRQYLHLRPKTNINSSLIRLSSIITSSLHSTLINKDYVHIFTPILTSNDCEGAGEVFTVRPASDDLCQQMTSSASPNLDTAYFNKKTYLTVSGQLHLEAMAGGLSKVYTLGPTFRAENSRSRRHLAEFRMLEVEMTFCQNLQPILSIMEHIIKQAATHVLEKGFQDINVVSKYYNTNLEKSLTNLLSKSFAVLSYNEAMELLLANQKIFQSQPRDGADLGVEHELFIVKHTGKPTFIIDWPADIKPFYMRSKDNCESLASCVDLLVPQVGELCGGSLRENRYHILKNRLELLKLEESLSWYLDLRRFGGAPTGGFGMGVERLIAYLLQVPNVKDIVPFPRTPHNCQM